MKKIFTIVLLALALGNINNLNAMRRAATTEEYVFEDHLPFLNRIANGAIDFFTTPSKKRNAVLAIGAIGAYSLWTLENIWSHDKILDDKSTLLGKARKHIWNLNIHNKDIRIPINEKTIIKKAQKWTVEATTSGWWSIPLWATPLRFVPGMPDKVSVPFVNKTELTKSFWLVGFVKQAHHELRELNSFESFLTGSRVITQIWKKIRNATLLFLLKNKMRNHLDKIEFRKSNLMFILSVVLSSEEYKNQVQHYEEHQSHITSLLPRASY